MSALVPTYAVPSEVNAGDTVTFLVAGGATPASDWTGAATMYGPSVVPGTVTASGSDFLVTFTAASTSGAAAGDYRIVLTATRSSERATVLNARIRIAADPTAVEGASGLEHCQRTLTIINAAIEGRLTADLESYSIAGRSVSKIPIAELVKLQGIYVAKVRSLINAGRPRPSLHVQFTRPDMGAR